MDPTVQQILVNSHIAALEAEAAAQRAAAGGRPGDPKPSLRASLARRLIAIGAVIAATPPDEPRSDAGVVHGA